jgi:hypothetical protein
METSINSHMKPFRIIVTLTIMTIIFFHPWPPARSESVTASTSTRSNLIPAVVYVGDSDRHIYEIAFNRGAWQVRDLTDASGAPIVYYGANRVMAFQRGDGVPMVVFRDFDKHIHAIYLELAFPGGAPQEVWHWADLTNITSSPLATSDPFGYVRSDGVSTVVYTGEDKHIHELRLETSWIWADLTAIAGSFLADWYEPVVAYIRGDGINTIVYMAETNGHICELRLESNWVWGDLTAISGAPVNYSVNHTASTNAYVRSDGIATVIYSGPDGHIEEIRLDPTWTWADLTVIPSAPVPMYRPFGFVRGDGISTIVSYYVDMSDPFEYEYYIYALYLDTTWQSYDLTSVPNAVQGWNPVGYVRSDGVSSVVYHGTDKHIDEIWLGSGGWQWRDLTSLSGAPDARSCGHWAYNRRTFANIYLPLDTK